jgi:hypothetical protein
MRLLPPLAAVAVAAVVTASPALARRKRFPGKKKSARIMRAMIQGGIKQKEN